MKIGRGSTRLRLGLVTGVALLAFAALFVGSASAQATPPPDWSGLPAGYQNEYNAFNPLDANIPNLAWRGEEVRLVKCDWRMPDAPGSVLPNQTLYGFFVGNRASLQVEDWSGTQLNSYEGPKPLADTFRWYYDSSREEWCVSGDFISNKPGLAIIKLSVSDSSGVQQVIHEFLVGWMSINTVDITNPGTVSELPGTTPGNSANVQVTGAIPMNAEFQADWGLPDPLVLPNDWAMWAHAMATTDPYDIYPGAPPAYAYWDIHDSSGPLGNENPNGSPDVHVDQSQCPGSTPDAFVDQVDNCVGGWSFSRIFGGSTVYSATGPFDSVFADTLLSDGRLNSSDAPMPPLKIVYNTSGGMGYFDNYSVLASKECVYNRNSDLANGNCVAPGTHVADPHALYAPYYNLYIPATSRDPYGSASGTDSPYQGPNNGQPNNFSGYGWYGKYDLWEIANVLQAAQGGDSGCLLTSGGERQTIDRGLNEGPTQIVEFTDEHGEARAQWVPGVNADFFANYANNNGEGGCDLEGVTFPNQTISATAQYPFQTVTATGVTAPETITKNILNAFQKTVSCVAKTQPNGTVVGYICTATAIDITNDGSIFNGEQVCFSREPGGVWYDYINGTGGTTPYQDTICETLSGGGPGVPASASAETLATLTGSQLDISANFTGEHIVRDTCFVVGSAGSTGEGPCTAGTGGTTGGTTTGGTTTGGTTTGGTTTGGTTTGGTTTGAAGNSTTTGGTSSNQQVTTLHGLKKVKQVAHLASVQLVLHRNGRVLYVKVLSRNKTAKIQVRLVNAKGKVVKTIIRTVKSNHRVAVKGLVIGKNVKHVRVAVLH